MRTEKRLMEIQSRLLNATPGPWETGMTAPMTPDEQAEYTKRHLSHGPVDRIHMVWAPSHPLTVIGADRKAPDHAVTPAITGNGPTSAANAEFIAAAPDDIAWLATELLRARIALELVRAVTWSPVEDGGPSDMTPIERGMCMAVGRAVSIATDALR